MSGVIIFWIVIFSFLGIMALVPFVLVIHAIIVDRRSPFGYFGDDPYRAEQQAIKRHKRYQRYMYKHYGIHVSSPYVSRDEGDGPDECV